jgi:hypothetical protein
LVATTHTLWSLKFSILEVLSQDSGGKAHKINVIGRANQPGALESHLASSFQPIDRALAYRAFEQLRTDGLICPTLDDLIAPESWFVITERGRTALARRALDSLDERLHSIGPHLVEIRAGAWSAVASKEPDALRQAAHSGRELIDQVLKQAALDADVIAQSWFIADSSSKSGVTRKHRLRYIMLKFRQHESDSELRVAEKACELVLAIDDRLMGLSHSRTQPTRSDVEDAMAGAEIALRRLLLGETGDG